METVNWKVKGMSCTNCALTIHKYLEGKGMQDVKVNFIGGDVSFNNNAGISNSDIEKGIDKLGYHVVHDEHHHGNGGKKGKFLSNHLHRFLFCAVFTIPLLLHMAGLHIMWLMSPYVQLALTLPVFVTGMVFFGPSALRSLLKGVPNMNVLIVVGALASFGYSLYGTLTGNPAHFMFYETTATIVTLIFLGNWMEDKAVETTQASLKKLAVTQKVMANMIAYDDQHQEHIFPVESTDLRTGDIILIKNGDYVPMDCKILDGEASVNESILTGESVPVEKKVNDQLIGGSIVANGMVKAYVTAVGENTVMSHILKMVRDAQSEKPPIQQLADRISAIFVPVVVGIAAITFMANYFIAGTGAGESLLRSVAVLVISCPCAMGLATPAAIAVGLGRAARNGVLFKNARSLEVFKNIKQVVFDKTGTLTTGKFIVSGFYVQDNTITQDEFKRLVYSLERYSNHPIARSIIKEWKTKETVSWSSFEEIKGQGIKAVDKQGNTFFAGSYIVAEALTTDAGHNVYIVKNNTLLGWVDVADELRQEAKPVVVMLQKAGIKTILLSGDRKEKCEAVAKELGIDEVIAQQNPAEKLERIAALSKLQPTAMVGDGINDAPALAKATVGISLSDASHIAMQSAQVVLMNFGLQHLPLALGLGKHTYTTVKQNLFWAFAYNVIAIPVAALGFLSPGIAALAMGFSDVVLAVNSVRLNRKKVS
ncbi:MAG TPA: cation-translocating P-type ATPase [Chitinophagaceae bacterium]|nr:cation-translocating P-type ATPase [Chitinophagaceae bacterium]